MNSKKPKIKNKQSLLFFGNERLATGVNTAAPVLQALITAGYHIEAVMANHTDSVSRQSKELEIGRLAHTNNIPVILPGHTIPLQEKVTKHQADLAILVAFGQIVPQSIIDMFPLGIINIHPSLLPAYRGSTPIESSMLNGDVKTGVSLMRLAREMDAGPIYAQQEIKLTGTETKQELADTLGKIGANLLIECLPSIIDGSLQPKDQVGKPTITKRILKTDGLLDPSKSAVELEREVRAFAGWPKSYFDWDDKTYIVHKAEVSGHKTEMGKLKVEDKKLYFGCNNSSLEILEIQPAGKPKMIAAAFINGYQI